MDARYSVLFEPVRIGPVTAPNRFYQVPHCTGAADRAPEDVAAMCESAGHLTQQKHPIMIHPHC